MRFFLLDVSRGVSVLAMICYHFYWDLGYFGFIDLRTVMQGLGLLAAQVIGVSFITIAGISGRVLTFSNNFKAKFSKRIVRLIILSTMISLATFLIDKNSFIFFGILHFLTICSIISLILVNVTKSYLLFLLFIVVGIISSSSISFDLPTILSWLGFNKNPPITNDFYPLFPWLTFYLFGFWVGHILMRRKSSFLGDIFFINPVNSKLFKFIEYIGKNSLIIYILHQPILFSLFLIGIFLVIILELSFMPLFLLTKL